MAQAKVSAMKRNRGIQRVSTMASAMNPYLEKGPDSLGVWNEEKGVSNFGISDWQPR